MWPTLQGSKQLDDSGRYPRVNWYMCTTCGVLCSINNLGTPHIAIGGPPDKQQPPTPCKSGIGLIPHVDRPVSIGRPVVRPTKPLPMPGFTWAFSQACSLGVHCVYTTYIDGPTCSASLSRLVPDNHKHQWAAVSMPFLQTLVTTRNDNREEGLLVCSTSNTTPCHAQRQSGRVVLQAARPD